MQAYPLEVEQQMQRFYHSLSEKDRRRYAAVEALKLGWGGLSYISQLLGCDPIITSYAKERSLLQLLYPIQRSDRISFATVGFWCALLTCESGVGETCIKRDRTVSSNVVPPQAA